MGVPQEYRNALHVSLIGRDNETYRGTLVLKNWTLQYPGPLLPARASTSSPVLEDPTGASYYVIAVVLVYGMSIVMLIASHIKRNHQKLEEDKQIHKYFQEFMVVKEKSSREAYRKLKKSIVKKLMWENNPTYRNLQRAILPAIAVPVAGPLLMLTQDQELDALRRGQRGASPVPSVNEQTGSHHSVSKQRRKGLGNLFTAAPPKDFELSVLEQLTELKGFRQEVRARANSVAFSNNSSFDISGLRSFDVESGSESNIDNQSEDSHITLPAITLRGPSPEPLPMRGRSPLPTIADIEDSPHVSDQDEDEEEEDIWLMGDGKAHAGGTMQRRVHFSSSTKRKKTTLALAHAVDGAGGQHGASQGSSRSSSPATLVRQDNVVMSTDSENEEEDDYGYTDSDSEENDEALHKITCV